MRKFLMVAALVAVAACGKKQGDTGSMEATGAAAGAAIDTAAHNADSTMGAMADSAHAAVDTSKTAVQKAADALSAPADSVNKKMEKNPATPPKN